MGYEGFDCSDVQGFVNPPRVKGKGQKGKGQGRTLGNSRKSLVPIRTKKVDFRPKSWGPIRTKSDKIRSCPELRAWTRSMKCQTP